MLRVGIERTRGTRTAEKQDVILALNLCIVGGRRMLVMASQLEKPMLSCRRAERFEVNLGRSREGRNIDYVLLQCTIADNDVPAESYHRHMCLSRGS